MSILFTTQFRLHVTQDLGFYENRYNAALGNPFRTSSKFFFYTDM